MTDQVNPDAGPEQVDSASPDPGPSRAGPDMPRQAEITKTADSAAFLSASLPAAELSRSDLKPGRWLQKAAKPGKGYIQASLMVGVGLTALSIVQAWLIAAILHGAIIESRPLADLWPLFWPLLGIIALRFPLTAWQEVLSFKAAAAVRLALRDLLFSRMMSLGPAWARTRSSGSLSTILVSQIEALEGFYARFLPLMRLSGMVPLILALLVFPLSWAVGLLFLIMGPLIPVSMALIGKRTQKASDRQARALTRIGGYYLDRLQGLGTLKLFGAADAELTRITGISDDFRKRTMAVLRVAFLSSTALELFASLSIALVAIYVGLSLLGSIGFGLTGWYGDLFPGSESGDMTLFTGLFLLLLAPEFFQPLRQLAAAYHDRASAVAAAEEIQGIFQAEAPGLAGGTDALPAPVDRIRLEVRELSFTWQDVPRPESLDDDGDGLTVIDIRPPLFSGLSFALEPGEIVALSAPSGGGKSTLIEMLLGFRRPDGGDILLNGTSLARLSEEARLQAMTWIGQTPTLFHGSLRDNILMGNPAASDADLQEAIARANVSEFLALLPEGLDSHIGEGGTGLSGGQAQRVALARALLSPAALIIMDEPTANLDRDSEAAILQCLDGLRGQKTVLVATHAPAVLRHADRILRFDGQGGITA